MAEKPQADRPEETGSDSGPGVDGPDKARSGQPSIVGIGASAGGVKAFQELVGAIPADAGLAWVLVQHMAPDRPSHLAEILARKTELPVTEVTETVRVEPNHVYVIAPGRTMTIRDGHLRPVPDGDLLSRRTSIDAFLVSLADICGHRSGCALLSGAGTDGTIGLKAIKEAGGLTVTQSLDTAEYDSMLLSAVRTGLVDRELAVEEMPAAFVDFLTGRASRSAEEAVPDGERLDVCRILRLATGHDFSGYKSSTVDRRIRRRMQMLNIASLGEYVKRLEEDKSEAHYLFRDLLIGVTQFFRDSDAFTALAKRVVPELLKGKTADHQVRVWVPGCATGEEAYSLAILLSEECSRLDSPPSVKVFGSDIDDNALQFARIGRYPKGIVADMTKERLTRFFEKDDGTYSVRPQLREMCLFAQHNVLRDPPFSRVDLISCRNLLIYMNTDLQKRLLPVFHYALRQDGILFLGPAENASQHPDMFSELDRQHRIFRRIGAAGRMPEFPIAHGDGKGQEKAAPKREDREKQSQPNAAVSRILERFAPAYVVIDQDYEILEASAGTGIYLELPSGRPRNNLGVMARDGLAMDVRAAIAKVVATGERVFRDDLEVGTGRGQRRLNLVVEPLPGGTGGDRHYLVVFQEMPLRADQTGDGERESREDEVNRALEHELQATKERLQTTAEELETSNEELRSSNEELSSVNEELQSSNEELETSKEELQSINEELRTVNNELSSRVEELSRANSDLKNLFANTQLPMLFLDARFRIMNFTPAAKPLFRLRDHDTGRPLDELAGRIDYGGLKDEVRAVISGGKPVEREVASDDGGKPGRTFLMRIQPYRGEDETIAGAVLTFVDISERKRNEERLTTMVSELNHRVKNALASVQAIVRQTESWASSVEEFGEAVRGRLQAMAAAHNILSSSGWETAMLGDLVATVLAPFAKAGSPRLSVAGPNIQLDPAIVVSISMILHELATNAAKFGAWSTLKGSVSLVWEFRQGDHATLDLAWEERGGPEVTPPDGDGFGMKLVRQCAEHELDGGFEPDFRPEGLVCRFSIPGRHLRLSN